jgi:hypothetical protein
MRSMTAAISAGVAACRGHTLLPSVDQDEAIACISHVRGFPNRDADIYGEFVEPLLG